MSCYYNEFDPFAAQWLRQLISEGLIASGDVDERSIEDVKPDELVGYAQCHFFAGIGGWPLALQLAGWPADRPVWTGSCPCQPFSAAGKGAGFDDERHLWPSFHWLISQCRPPIVFGEQVASKAVDAWIDLVHTDLEALGYAFGSVPFPAASVGAPHIRDRNYWVGALGHATDSGHQQRELGNQTETQRSPLGGGSERGQGGRGDDSAHDGDAGWVADSKRPGPQGGLPWRAGTERQNINGHPGRSGAAGGLADSEHLGHGRSQATPPQPGGDQPGVGLSDGGHPIPEGQPAAGPTNGHWGATDWLFCRDGKWRPVEPGTFPLVDGVSNRVGLLRGYGNAIVPQAAAEFIASHMDITEQRQSCGSAA